MPELPEVETIRRGLNKFILEKSLKKITVLNEKSFLGEKTLGRILNIRRYGKALILDLDNHKSLMIHLRMTGQLIFEPETGNRYAAGHPSENFLATLPNNQTRVILEFENGTLYFNDQRKFGFIKSLETKEVENDAFIKKLAKEPCEMSSGELYERFKKHQKSSIKSVLLDQSIICGLGNIYVDETLFASKIHPETRAGLLTEKDAENIIENAKKIMEDSINSGGSTMATYLKADGTRGNYLEKFAKVFRREGEKCLECGEKIIKIKVNGRGTHLCPNCQRRRNA